MKYTVKETEEKIKEVGMRIHHCMQYNQTEIQLLLEEVHAYISKSTIKYIEAYPIVREIAKTNAEFNTSMQRIKNTIYKRDRGLL